MNTSPVKNQGLVTTLASFAITVISYFNPNFFFTSTEQEILTAVTGLLAAIYTHHASKNYFSGIWQRLMQVASHSSPSPFK